MSNDTTPGLNDTTPGLNDTTPGLNETTPGLNETTSGSTNEMPRGQSNETLYYCLMPGISYYDRIQDTSYCSMECPSNWSTTDCDSLSRFAMLYEVHGE